MGFQIWFGQKMKEDNTNIYVHDESNRFCKTTGQFFF